MNLIAGLTAFFLGAMHALEPGHGKSAIAAYAVGYRSSLRHILVLGVSTAVAHTISIFVLAMVLGAAVSTVAGENAHKWIELVSSFLLIITGAWLARRAIKNRQASENRADAETSCGCRQHTKTIDENKSISFGFVSLLGISGGLIPCPTALAVLLSAMSAGQMSQGLWTVCLFSVGIALTLCTVALFACLIAKSSAVSRLTLPFNLSRLSQFMPIISAFIILGVGFVTLFRAVFHS